MRYAFVIGSNGPETLSPLKYARLDSERMKSCLEGSRCGYDVVFPLSTAKPLEIRQSLYELAERCTPKDTFICYFGGHGILEKGMLFLLWDETDLNRLGSTSIPTSAILEAFSFCKAHSTLLILDCCHAGAAISGKGFRSGINEPVGEIIHPDNHLVLMASDRLERARELEELEGGFLTRNIISAIEENFHDVDKSGDGKLSLQELVHWLKEKAIQHNQRFPDRKVPYPYTFGQEKGDFILTIDEDAWIPYEIPFPDESTMVILPICPMDEMAFCIGKHPVTNNQYKRFLEEGKALPNELFEEMNLSKVQKWFSFAKSGFVTPQKPKGKNFIVNEGWEGVFYPWKDELFNKDMQPVVCINFIDALSYCEWASKLPNLKSEGISVTLPSTYLWDFAALGISTPSYNDSLWLNQANKIHHKSDSPSQIDLEGERCNSRGVSDMFGNVWEWCIAPRTYPIFESPQISDVLGDVWGRLFNVRYNRGLYEHNTIQVISRPRIKRNPWWELAEYSEIRGGSFLDDLSKGRPTVPTSRLEESFRTQHSDLGFRIAGQIPVKHLPNEVQERLKLCKPFLQFRSFSY